MNNLILLLKSNIKQILSRIIQFNKHKDFKIFLLKENQNKNIKLNAFYSKKANFGFMLKYVIDDVWSPWDK